MGYEVNPEAYKKDPLYLKAVELYKNSEILERENKLDEALKAYLEVGRFSVV